MTLKQMLVGATTALLSVVAWADAANLLFSFSTPGPDTYADGKAIVDGEWYALCWTANESFGGLTPTCDAAVAGDKVLLMAPLAKGGHCPFTVFQVDSASAPKGGKYFVWVLDTRDGAGKPAAGAVTDGTFKPKTAVYATQSAAAITGSSATSKATVATATAGAAWSDAALSAEAAAVADQAKITAFKVEDAVVKITVSGMAAGARYNVSMGKDVENLSTYALEMPKTSADNDVTFAIDPGDARFFKVVRQTTAK